MSYPLIVDVLPLGEAPHSRNFTYLVNHSAHRAMRFARAAAVRPSDWFDLYYGVVLGELASLGFVPVEQVPGVVEVNYCNPDQYYLVDLREAFRRLSYGEKEAHPWFRSQLIEGMNRTVYKPTFSNVYD